ALAGHLAALPVAAAHPVRAVLGVRLGGVARLHDRAVFDAGHADADVAVLGADLGHAPVTGDDAGTVLRDALTAVGGVRLLPAHRAVAGALDLVRLGHAFRHVDGAEGGRTARLGAAAVGAP